MRLVALFALLSIALGFAMQGLIVLARLSAGGQTGTAQFVADVAHSVSWAGLVCLGIGVSTTLVRAKASVVGLVGLIAAPVGLALAKSVQKVVSGIVEATVQPAVLSLSTISLLRGVEYATLGWLLATLVRKGAIRPLSYLGAGVATGIGFGGAISALSIYVAAMGGTPMPDARIAATLVNEIGTPIGCAIVIFIGQIVSRNMRAIAPDEAPAS